MPKRKRDDKDSLSYIKKKIKKLERKMLKGRRRSSSSSDSERMLSKPQDNAIIESENNEDLPVDLDKPVLSISASRLESLQVSNLPEVTQVPRSQAAAEEVTAAEKDDQHDDLDKTVLEILGTDPSITTLFGKDIQKDLAVLYEFIATSGLTKELHKELLEPHLPPANYKLINAPSRLRRVSLTP